MFLYMHVCTATYHLSQKPFKSEEQDIYNTAGEVSKKELISNVLLWTPFHRCAKCAWQPNRTYLQQLCMDTRCSLEVMANRVK